MRERVGLWRHCRGEGEGLDKMDSHGIYRQMEDRLSGGLARKVGCWNIYI